MLDRSADTGTAPTPPERHGVRWPRVVGLSTILVALLVVVSVAGYVALLNHTVTTNVQHAPLLPTPGVDGVEDPPVKKAGREEAQNLLVIGRDRRDKPATQRSDVILLLHVAADQRSVSVVHLPRDLYVDIPGRGKDRIDAAHASGGAPLLVRTVQRLVGVPVDHVAVIGFEGFERMTDAVGGVEVQLDEPVTVDGRTFAAGRHRLDGRAALAFVSDQDRRPGGAGASLGVRQQAFIKALLLASLRRDNLANPFRLADLVEAGTSDLTVDQTFTVGEMRSRALGLRGVRGKDIRFVSAPHTGIRAADGGTIGLVEPAGMAALATAIQDDAMDGYDARSP